MPFGEQVQKLFANITYHAFKNKYVKWQQRVPIKPASQPMWPESGSLVQHIVVVDPELEPGFAGQFHFGI